MKRAFFVFFVFFVGWVSSFLYATLDPFLQSREIRHFRSSLFELSSVDLSIPSGKLLTVPLGQLNWSSDFFLGFDLSIRDGLLEERLLTFSGRLFHGYLVVFLNGRPLYVVDSFLSSDRELTKHFKHTYPFLISISLDAQLRSISFQFLSDVTVFFSLTNQSSQLEESFIQQFRRGDYQSIQQQKKASLDAVEEMKQELNALDQLKKDLTPFSYFMTCFRLFSYCLKGMTLYPDYILGGFYTRIEPFLPVELKDSNYQNWRVWLLKDEKYILGRIPLFQHQQEEEWLTVLDHCLFKWIQVTSIVHHPDKKSVIRVKKENRDKVLAFLGELKQNFFSLKKCSGQQIRQWIRISKAIRYQAQHQKDSYFIDLYATFLAIETYSWQKNFVIGREVVFSIINFIYRIPVQYEVDLKQLSLREDISFFFKRKIKKIFSYLTESFPFKEDLFISVQMTQIEICWSDSLSFIQCHEISKTHFIYELPTSLSFLVQEVGQETFYLFLSCHTLFLLMKHYSVDVFLKYTYLHFYLLSSMDLLSDLYRKFPFVHSEHSLKKKQIFSLVQDELFTSRLFPDIGQSLSFSWSLLNYGYFI